MWRFQKNPPQAWVASDEVFTPAEIDRIIAAPRTEKKGATVADGTVRDIRKSDVQWIAPSEKTEWLFLAVEDAMRQVNAHFHLDLSTLENLQFTEYAAEGAGHYGAHADNGYGGTATAFRCLSMSVQLSDETEYDGGEFLLYPSTLDPVQIPKRRGLVTFFRSHVVHEVRPVTKGLRRSLVAWASRPN